MRHGYAQLGTCDYISGVAKWLVSVLTVHIDIFLQLDGMVTKEIL